MTFPIVCYPRRRERARFAGFLAAAEEASASPIDAGASSDAHRFAPFRPGMSWSTGGLVEHLRRKFVLVGIGG